MAYSIFCNSILRGDVLKVTGDGSQSRSNTFVDDAAQAAILAGMIKPQEIMNISGAESISLLDAINVLETAIGKPASLEFVPQVMGDQKTTSGNSELAQTVLGWKPRMKVREGLTLQALAALADYESADS